MHLYTLEIPAYTLSTEDITITRVDNRRFTMRDIGKLEGRIENLEYYTQLFIRTIIKLTNTRRRWF